MGSSFLRCGPASIRSVQLLIAQTMAFVQSVTGKKPEADKTVAMSVDFLSVRTSETIVTSAPVFWYFKG